MLCVINVERTTRGLAPLRAQGALASVAGRYAREMVQAGFFDHTSPAGSTMLSRIRTTSYLTGAATWFVGENIGWGSGTFAAPAAMVDAWMRSPGHRANLLDTRFRDIGIGIASGAPEPNDGALGETYVTDFGRRRPR
jgi:uncharacterized protein YkwD